MTGVHRGTASCSHAPDTEVAIGPRHIPTGKACVTELCAARPSPTALRTELIYNLYKGLGCMRCCAAGDWSGGTTRGAGLEVVLVGLALGDARCDRNYRCSSYEIGTVSCRGSWQRDRTDLRWEMHVASGADTRTSPRRCNMINLGKKE